MDNHDEMEAFARELLFVGGCVGVAIGWAACAAWRGDTGSLAIVLAVFAAYLAYCRYREARSIDIPWPTESEVRHADV